MFCWVRQHVQQRVKLISCILIVRYFVANCKCSLQESQRWVDLHDTNTDTNMRGNHLSIVFVIQGHLVISARELEVSVSDRLNIVNRASYICACDGQHE